MSIHMSPCKNLQNLIMLESMVEDTGGLQVLAALVANTCLIVAESGARRRLSLAHLAPIQRCLLFNIQDLCSIKTCTKVQTKEQQRSPQCSSTCADRWTVGHCCQHHGRATRLNQQHVCGKRLRRQLGNPNETRSATLLSRLTGSCG